MNPAEKEANVEWLRCRVCARWWPASDDFRLPRYRSLSLFCPHCGTEREPAEDGAAGGGPA